ncbi:hypothetical protein [Streptomyces decoyicus]
MSKTIASTVRPDLDLSEASAFVRVDFGSPHRMNLKNLSRQARKFADLDYALVSMKTGDGRVITRRLPVVELLAMMQSTINVRRFSSLERRLKGRR